MKHTLWLKRNGFTLSELLIALMILSVIATFTIPKVLHNSNNSRRIAIFKEVIASTHEVITLGWMTSEINASNSGLYLNQRLNAYKLCSSNSSTQGCWDAAVQGIFVNNDQTQPGVILSNGARILTGQSACCDWRNSDGTNGDGNTFIVDWNGTEGPNMMGNDQIKFLYCVGPGDCWGVRPGTISAADGATNTTLYEAIFGK